MNGKEVDLDGLTEKQVEAKIKSLQRKINTLKKVDEADMTADQKETLAMIEFNLELASKYLRNLQEVKDLEDTEVKEPTPKKESVSTVDDIERRQRIADIITSQLELGIELPKILETLAEQGYVEKINNSAFFKQTAGRDAIVFNIDGAIIPIYRSSKGTSSKTKGKWYPFFFNAGDWLVKAGSDSYKDGYNNPIIKQILDSLNNNYKYDKSIATVEGNNKKILSLLGLEGFEEDNYGIYDYQNYAAIATILKDWQNKLGNIDTTGYQEYLDGASSNLIKANPTLRADIEKAFSQVSKLFAELAALEQPSMQVATEINPELKSQLNMMGYKNTAIKNLPKSILERIIREAIPYEEFKTRVIVQSLVTEDCLCASEGTPVVIKSTTIDGVNLQKVNGEESIFVTFDEFETRTSEKQKLSNMEPTTTTTELTPETQEILSKGKDAASNFTDAQIDALEKETSKEKLDTLEEDLFNSNPC